MALRRNIRLVSFDGGGGARTFSQLRIMGQIMSQLNCDRATNESDKIMLPCEHFDLIGGSGTGGLSAIMFGRLRMSVEEVSNEFFTIIEEVYKRDDLTPPERTRKLRECMEDVMERRGLPADMKLMEKTQPGHCASFVLASPCTNAAEKVCLRTYLVRNQLASSITVIDAILATCAVPPIFSSVTSGSGHNKQEYIGASFGATNPVREVITEAHSLFGGDSSVASLLSLGAGHPGVISFPSGDGVDLNRAMRDMMSDCEQTAQEIERQIGRVGIYFRFSVEQGMQSDRLGPAPESMQVLAQTEGYIVEHTTEERLSRLVQSFSTAIKLITLDQLEYAGGSTISIKSAATLEAILAALELNQEDAILAKLKVPGLECGPHTAECMAGTRHDILGRINAWTTDFDAPNILWLKGHPGVGKSAIAVSLVEQLRAARRLGSLFFFQRQRANLMTTNALWRTVAYDLAHKYPTIRTHLVAVLKADETIPTIFNADRLFRQLIKDPLLDSQRMPFGRSPIIVVDALDECGGLEGDHSPHRKNLLRTLQTWSTLPLKFKLIVTSRDESDLAGLFLRTTHHPIEISAGQTVEAQSSEDLRTFLTYRFEQIAIRHPRSLSPDWPGADTIVQMASIAAGLFIWADTVIRFIDLGQPEQRLSLVLEGVGSGDMAVLYEQILRTSFGSLRDHEVENLCSVIGTIILAKAPLSFSTLVLLLLMEDSTVEQICNGLQSVLESRNVLQFHHQSFVDFLTDPARSTSRFFVEREQETRGLTMACLRVMKDELRFNICDLKSSYSQNNDIPDLASRVEKYIPPHVSYSSSFWANHLAETTFDIQVFDALQYLMENQFLYWLEVLSLIKLVNLASSTLLLVVDWIRAGQRNDAMAKDMQKFVSAFGSVISQSIPHIYLSALPFSPRNSAVSKQYRKRFPQTIATKTGGLINWPVMQNVLSGHDHSVSSVVFSSDGKRIVSGSYDKTIRVWDGETGELVAGPFNHDEGVTMVAISPDGRRIVHSNVSVFDSKETSTWVCDAETGEVIAGPFEGPSKKVNSVAFSPDGTRIATADGFEDYTIRVWDVETAEMVAGPFAGHSSSVTSVTFSPDGTRIISGSWDETIRVWDANTGEVVAGPFEGHSGHVTFVAISPDGARIISAAGNQIWVRDAETGEVVRGPFEGQSGHATSVAISPDGARIASAADNRIWVWDADTGEVVAGPFEGHSYTVAFSPDGTRVISGGYDKTIRVWAVEADAVEAGHVNGHTKHITFVAFSQDGKRIASSFEDNTICVWDAETSEQAAGPFNGHSDRIIWMSFSRDGLRVISGSWDGKILMWDAETGEVVAGPLSHGGDVESIAISPDGTRIVSGSDGIRVWDAETGAIVGGPFEGKATSVAFSPNGTRIVSSAGNKILVRDAKTGEVIVGPFEGLRREVTSVAFSPDGTRLVSGSSDGIIRVWDAEAGKVVMGPSPDVKRSLHTTGWAMQAWDTETGEVAVGPFAGHSGQISSVAFSPDGMHIVSGSWDMTIRVWNPETGEVVVGPWEVHRHLIFSVSFSPDGKRILSASGSTIWAWGFQIDEPGSHNHNLPPFSPAGMQDGWILGSNSELLLWVPPILRDGLWWPNKRLAIGNFIQTKLDLAHFVHGESWSQCKG